MLYPTCRQVIRKCSREYSGVSNKIVRKRFVIVSFVRQGVYAKSSRRRGRQAETRMRRTKTGRIIGTKCICTILKCSDERKTESKQQFHQCKCCKHSFRFRLSAVWRHTIIPCGDWFICKQDNLIGRNKLRPLTRVRARLIVLEKVSCIVYFSTFLVTMTLLIEQDELGTSA